MSSEPDLAIAVGDRVRSYDFPMLPGIPGNLAAEGVTACFVEGVVVDILPAGVPHPEANMQFATVRYVIRCTRRVRSGAYNHNEVGMLFFPPLNGTPDKVWGGITSGVVRLETCDTWEQTHGS
jgi:hypothetical protein